jgi:flagellar motility protein MotE (MotC chaperone)
MVALRPRLLPVVIVAAFLLLGLKIGDLWSGEGASAIATAWAQAGSAPEKAGDDKPSEPPAEKLADAAPAKAAEPAAAGKTQKPGGKPAEIADASAAPGATKAAEPAAAPAGKGAAAAPARDPLLMSPAEIDELQHLSERRAELDKRAAGMRDQEVLMQAAEKRIEERIAKLQALEQSIDGSAQKMDEEDDARVKSLVHIYEAMKPAEAARIFEQLDMPVLLSVVEHMRETKAALVLAAMDPTKAKSVTMALAERRARVQAQAQVQPAQVQPASLQQPPSGATKPAPQASAQPGSATR